MNTNLDVYVGDHRVGVLREKAETGLIDFEYELNTPEEAAASLLMPTGVPPDDYMGYNGLPPPFEVSLPEGMLLEAIQTRFGKHIDVSSDIALLQLVGRHTIGRVTFGGPLAQRRDLEEEILIAARTEGAAIRLAEILRAAPEMFGISGVMPKMSLFNGDARCPGTVAAHGAIIKFDSVNFPGASLVEYACLKVCAVAGLSVPKVELGPDLTSIIIERFDPAPDGRRFGFEDACALSGIRRAGKYNGSLEHLFCMVENFVHTEDQMADRLALLKLILMNDVLRNGDAHLKNFGLLYDDVDRPRLAPVFDVLTTQVWIPGDTPALSIGKLDRDSGEWMNGDGLQRLALLSGESIDEIVSIRKAYATLASKTMIEVLDDVPPSRERASLERASHIVGYVS